MISFDSFFQYADGYNKFQKFNETKGIIEDALKHGDLQKWNSILESLPNIENVNYKLNEDIVQISASPENQINKIKLKRELLKFSPWRKGPFNLFDVFIDTEWRSDLKWNRIKNDISPLENRNVLDVGCGSGYHCWRMLGESAKTVIGIEPYLLNVFQFNVFKKFLDHLPGWVLPLKMEQLPENLGIFDTVFSMGILYHRKSPFDHLAELRAALRSKGELILETLVIEGEKGKVLVPEDRYAKMRNVWFIPTALTLESWLKKAGFKNIKLVDVTKTTEEEQRKTKWMTWESLNDFLNADDKSKTIEGYPAPKRAAFIAEAP